MKIRRIFTFAVMALSVNTAFAGSLSTTTSDEAIIISTRTLGYEQLSEAYPQPRRSALVAQAMQSLLVNETLALLDEDAITPATPRTN